MIGTALDRSNPRDDTYRPDRFDRMGTALSSADGVPEGRGDVGELSVGELSVGERVRRIRQFRRFDDGPPERTLHLEETLAKSHPDQDLPGILDDAVRSAARAEPVLTGRKPSEAPLNGGNA